MRRETSHPAALGAGVVGAYLLFSVLSVVVTRLSGMQGASATALATFAMDMLSMAVACVAIAHMGRFSPYGSRPGRKTVVVACLLLLAAWLAGTCASTFVFLQAADDASAAYAESAGWMGPSYILFALVLAPVTEELVFRGAFLGGMLRTKIPPLAAAVASAAIFAWMHGTAMHIAPTFLLGLLCSWAYMRWGSVLPSMAAHALSNGLTLLLTGMPLPEPMVSLPFSVVSVVVVAGLLVGAIVMSAKSERRVSDIWREAREDMEGVEDATEDDD